MQLNLDVLSLLASQLKWRRDILALMRTCKSVYAAGIPALLRQDVSLNKKEKLASFCDFILADTQARAKHIKGLELAATLGKASDEVAGKLGNVLQHASGLERLTLAKCDSLVSAPAIATALAGLTSLKELYIRDCDTTVVDIVQQMKSSVEKASIQLNGQIDEDKSNPIPLLAPFQHSLRKLFLWEPQLLSDDDEVKEIVFPKLTQLDAIFWNNVELEPMLRAFPNVKRFTVGLQGYDDGGLEEDKDEIREKNEAAQEEMQWSNMEYVQGDPISLYITALKSNIAKLEMRINWDADAETISAILEAVQTERLDFRFETDWENEPDVSERLPSILEAAAENITHLFIEIRQIDELEPAIELVCNSLAGLTNLIHLTLELRKAKSDDDSTPEDIAQRIAEASPSVQHMALSVAYAATSYWQVVRPDEDVDDEDSVQVEELTTPEARELGCPTVDGPAAVADLLSSAASMVN